MNPWHRLLQSAERSPRLLVGLMSGTSADATDAALIEVTDTPSGTEVVLRSFVSLPFPPELRDSILAVSHGEGNAETIARLSVELAEEYTRAVSDLRKSTPLATNEAITAIGCHGQTIAHTPYGLYPTTFQIGDPATLAQRTGIPVVSDFRAADIAVGGQGAPLTPFADWKLMTHPSRSRAIQNIGGIANVTYLPANAAIGQVIGFDTGPGNMLIDLAAQWATDDQAAYDVDGRLAAQGSIRPELLDWLFGHPFLARKPPKSAGREEFGREYWRSLIRHVNGVKMPFPRPVDMLATVTAFTAFSIASAYADHLPSLPDEVIVSGGGARNPVLMRFLVQKLAPIPVLSSDAMGINPNAREAVAFALFADETLHGRPANLPAVTGACCPVVLGSVTLAS